jgi:hypothetical protein
VSAIALNESGSILVSAQHPVLQDGYVLVSAGIRPDGTWVGFEEGIRLTAINDSGVSVGADYSRAVSRAIRMTW